MTKQDKPKAPTKIIPRRVDKVPEGYDFKRNDELGNPVYGKKTETKGDEGVDRPKPKTVTTPVNPNNGNPNSSKPPRIVPKFREKLPTNNYDEVTMFNDKPKPEIKSADSPLYGSVDIHRQIDPTASNQHYTAYKYPDANGNYTNKATTRYFEAKPSNGQDAQELNNDLTKSYDAKGNFVPSVVPNSYLNSGANVGGISRIMSPKDSGVNKMAEGQVNNFTLPGTQFTKNSGSGGSAIVKGSSGIQNNIAGNSDAFIPKKYNTNGIEIPQENTGIQDINAPKLPAKEVGEMYPSMPKFKKGGIVKGYADGGDTRPEVDPMRQQGVVQIGTPQYSSTGNATNNQGQQSSQVNQSGKEKGSMFNSSTISGLTGAATTLGAGLAANQQLKGEQKRKADVGAINSTVDSVASMVPVYGQIYAGAKAASGIGRSAIAKDTNGNATTAEGAAMDSLFTPVHEQAINEISKGDYGGAALDVATGGIYRDIKNYADFDKNKALQEEAKQKKLDEFRKINAESKGKQAMAARDSGDFGAQAKDVYDINSAQFDNAGNFQSINPTGYKGGGLVGKIKQMCAEGGSIKPTITNDKVMEVAMSGKGYDTLNKYDKQRVDSMKQHMSSQGDKDIMSFPKMIQGKADGGEIAGKGTGKSDSIHAKVEEGSFVVPAENADLAKGVRKLLLKAPNKKANVNQKEGEEVKLSNGEHLFTPEENEYLESIGVNLEALAPNAEKEEDGKAKGGPILNEKEAKQGLNNAKTQQFLLRQKLNKQIYDYEANPNKDPNQLGIINALKSKVKTINDTYGYKNEYTSPEVNNKPVINKTTSVTNNPSQSLRAPKVKQVYNAPLEMKKAPQASSMDANGNVIAPTEANIATNNLKIQDPNTGQQVGRNSKKGKGILNALGNIDPTMAVGPMQTAMGINMLQGSTRPIDKAVLDATYNGNVNRAQGQAGYGYSPEQMAMLNNENQNSLTDARFSARNFAGGNSSTAFNQERQAINQGWANKLGLTSADQQLRMQKQQYADEQVANRASILSANRRQAYTDALGAFQQKQQAGSELVGAGLQNTIGAYRYNKELSNENKADAERNRWTSEIGKTNV